MAPPGTAGELGTHPAAALRPLLQVEGRHHQGLAQRGDAAGGQGGSTARCWPGPTCSRDRKGVLLLTFGANQHNIPLAALGAAAAVVVVVVTTVGMVVRAPLARVPENNLKFIVGVLLTAFGTFWSVEGAGGSWPRSDLALLGVIAFVAAVATAAVRWLRGVHARQRPGVKVRDQSLHASTGGVR